jgi:hypothetical protein
VVFDVADPHGTLQGLTTLPEFILELGLGIHATFWGFKASSPILRGDRSNGMGTASTLRQQSATRKMQLAPSETLGDLPGHPAEERIPPFVHAL